MDKSKLSKSQQKAVDDGKLVETVNSLDPVEFIQRYLQDDHARAEEEISHKTGTQVNLDLHFSQTLESFDKGMLDDCFDLIRQNSASDYAASEIKWSPASKRKEMVLPDMRYLILKEDTPEVRSATSAIPSNRRFFGFVSFMTTYEDGFEVLYVYEIHLRNELRGQGVGTILMNTVEKIGRRIGLEKCMLTVFKSNKKAVKWYERCGYALDDFSPQSRVLRNGTIKQPTYLILSRSLSRD